MKNMKKYAAFHFSKTFRKITALLSGLVLTQGIAQNTIVIPDSSSVSQPHLTSSANGTPVVNITAPNSAGLSMNHYTQFDVGNQGLILNNATALTQTQIGGSVQANANLSGTSATTIVNQINSSNPSYLNGVIEVAGGSAHVIIANPSGISSNGGRFIHTNRVTLFTGLPVLAPNGSLDSYRVRGGQIHLGHFDSSTANATEIFARAIQISQKLQAGNELNLTTGINDIAADGYTVTNRETSADAITTPTVAIDTAALGGMYAGKIHLLATEKGAGVHHRGELKASSGGITITADGKITHSGKITAPKSIKITSKNQDINHTGKTISTASSVYLHSDNGKIEQQGEISADALTEFKARDIHFLANSKTHSRGNVETIYYTDSEGEYWEDYIYGEIKVNASQSLVIAGGFFTDYAKVHLNAKQISIASTANFNVSDALFFSATEKIAFNQTNFYNDFISGLYFNAPLIELIDSKLSLSYGSWIQFKGQEVRLNNTQIDKEESRLIIQADTLNLSNNSRISDNFFNSVYRSSLEVNTKTTQLQNSTFGSTYTYLTTDHLIAHQSTFTSEYLTHIKAKNITATQSQFKNYGTLTIESDQLSITDSTLHTQAGYIIDDYLIYNQNDPTYDSSILNIKSKNAHFHNTSLSSTDLNLQGDQHQYNKVVFRVVNELSAKVKELTINNSDIRAYTYSTVADKVQ
jgi:filamentous hemagglutinin family protein